jgi:SsrA-binding protein
MVKREEKIIAQHKRARYDYEIIESLEAGIVLLGSEVKSLRFGKTSINESYAGEMADDPTAIYLFNANISEYNNANKFGHDPKRPRKLLLKNREVKRLLGNVRKKGYTLIPLRLYFNQYGKAKLEIALGRGKNTVDKRETIKERDWNREKSRILRDNNGNPPLKKE